MKIRFIGFVVPMLVLLSGSAYGADVQVNGFFYAVTNNTWGTSIYGDAYGGGGTGVYGIARGSYATGGYFTGTGSSSTGVNANGTLYDFYASGAGTNYAPFTGSHEVKLGSNFPTEPKSGLVVSVTGKVVKRLLSDGSVSVSSSLPTVKLADKPNDSAVFGVFVKEAALPNGHWYTSEGADRFGVVNALGEGRVWVTNINGNIEAGDYITTSTIPGYGCRQAEDILHSYTLGKAIERVDWDAVTETLEVNGITVKIYLIALVYTSG